MKFPWTPEKNSPSYGKPAWRSFLIWLFIGPWAWLIDKTRNR